jgi:membrane protein
MAGGFVSALAFEAAKAGLAWYLETVPSFSLVYGTFATLPILMLWVYLAWVIVLLGAVVAAYAPSLQMRVTRRPGLPGDQFDLALALLRLLDAARALPARGLSAGALAAALRTDPLQIEPVLEQLVALGWVARLEEESAGGARMVLLAPTLSTPAAPLIDALLLHPSGLAEPFRRRAGIEAMTLGDLIG